MCEAMKSFQSDKRVRSSNWLVVMNAVRLLASSCAPQTIEGGGHTSKSITIQKVIPK